MTIEERERKKEGITKLLNVKKKQHSEKKKKVVEFCFEIVLGFSVCLCLVFFFLFFFFLRSLVAGGRGNGSRSNCWRN